MVPVPVRKTTGPALRIYTVRLGGFAYPIDVNSWPGANRARVQHQALSSQAVQVAVGAYGQACVLTSAGGVKCWSANASGTAWAGNAAVPVNQPNYVLTAVDVLGLTSGVAAISAGASGQVCARLTTGALKCWGDNLNGELGDGTLTSRQTPVSVSGVVSNGSPHVSQGSVLVHKESAQAGDPVSGHVTPMPWSMTNAATGNVSLMVTYDPLAAAAAMFIEQYDAHIAACNATTSESITQAQQQAGTYLWACSNATAKATCLAGMQTLLNGARHYLFGADNGCIVSTQTVAGAACPATITGPDPVHYPYTVVVPGYTTFDSGYYASVSTAIAGYQSSLIGSGATRLERTLQLASVRQFTAGNDAIVTTRLTRAGQTNPTACVLNDGFSTKLQ